MALRTKTVRYATGSDTVGFVTTTGFTGIYDAPAITVRLPETASRTIRSVTALVSWHCSWDVAANITGVRLRAKLGSATEQDRDWTPTAQNNTGDPESVQYWSADFTDYFVANFGTGASQTCVLSMTVATSTASRSINAATMELLITYEYEDAGITEELKTVVIPIQSHHTTLTASHQEIGTTGGANNAPENQIPSLDTFLPESGKVIRQAYLIIEGSDGGAATTDFNLFARIDATTEENVTGNREMALNGSSYMRVIWLYDTTTHLTSAAHALFLRSSLTTRFVCPGALLVVTYSYDPSATTRVLASLALPCSLSSEGSIWINGTETADADAFGRELWIEDRGTIALRQSAVHIRGMAPAASTIRVWAGAQSERTYTVPALVDSGGQSIVHRIDHNSSVALVRGANACAIRLYTTVQTTFAPNYGILYINYEHDMPTEGGVPSAFRGSHSTHWLISEARPTSGAIPVLHNVSSGWRTPNIPEAQHRLLAVGYHMEHRVGVSAAVAAVGRYEAGDALAGWAECLPTTFAVSDSELGTSGATHDAMAIFRAVANIETPRPYRVRLTTAGMLMHLGAWVSWHAYRYEIAGTVAGSDGGTVTLRAHNASTGELLGATTRSGDGSYTIAVDTDIGGAMVEAREDATHLGRSDDATPVLT